MRREDRNIGTARLIAILPHGDVNAHVLVYTTNVGEPERLFRIPIPHHVVMQGKLFDIRQWLVERVCSKEGCSY